MSSPQQTRTEIRREDDDELLGFVGVVDDGVADDGAAGGGAGVDETAVAFAVFGGQLGVHYDAEAAEHQIREIGLSSLAERWWIDAGDGWEPCWLIEASPERLVAVIAAYPFMASPRVVPPGTPLRLTPPQD